MKKILVIDRDGTLLKEPRDFQIDSFKKIKFVKDVIPSLLKLKSMGFTFVLVSNQDSLGTEKFPYEDFEGPQNLMIHIFEAQGITFQDVLICPHGPDDKCGCRKPLAGLFSPRHFQNVNFDKSFVVGDRSSDLELAKNIGFKGLKIDQEEGWEPIVRLIQQSLSSVSLSRKTKETSIEVTLTNNNEGQSFCETSLPFMDHMIEQISKHSGISIDIFAKGDLWIDEHHLIEDIAIVLGESVRQLFSEGIGLKRFGFLLPMDESLCQMALDISGRPFAKIDMEWSESSVGNIKTSLIEHFFRSFSHSGQLNLNLKASGQDNHHICESSFKALGQCLGQAFSETGRSDIPSTKGVL